VQGLLFIFDLSIHPSGSLFLLQAWHPAPSATNSTVATIIMFDFIRQRFAATLLQK
jgi:hypothetical protein